jgi:hypothetical protein
MTKDNTPPTDPMDSSIGTGLDWAEKDRQYTALAETIRPANKAALFDALTAAGVTTVFVEFDGSCDSGQIENVGASSGEKPVDLPDGQIEIAQARWGRAEITRQTLPIREAVEQLVYDLLEETHAGWEINDGAFGDFTFDVAERTITLNYNQRITDVTNFEDVF